MCCLLSGSRPGEIGGSQPAGHVSPGVNLSLPALTTSNRARVRDLVVFKENWSLLLLTGKVDVTAVSQLQGTNLPFRFNEAQPCSAPLS